MRALLGMVAAFACVGAGAQETIKLTVGAQSVPRYARVEFDLTMPPCAGNPVDPAEVEVNLQVAAPDGTVARLPCFAYQAYDRRRVDSRNEMKDWLYPVGDLAWRARFAPSQVGAYRCRAERKCRGQVEQSDEVTLECTASDSKGFVRVSQRNPRYFEFADGSPCFFLGQNLAFVKDTYRQEALLSKLGAGGGNFARVWACCGDWGMSLQGRKSAWGRSWDWNPPIVAEPGGPGFDSQRLCVKLAAGSQTAVSPSHPVALRPETDYLVRAQVRTEQAGRLALSLDGKPLGEPLASPGQWKAFEAPFRSGAEQWWLGQLSLKVEGEGAAWLNDLSLREAAGGPELLWEADVNRPVLGEVNLLDAAMLDTVVEAAERAGVYLQVVVLPRDPYWECHPTLKRGGQDGPDYDQAIRDAEGLLRYAVARWGYSTSIAAWEYFNEIDPESPTDRFYDELGRYLELTDVYHHPRVTSAWGPSPKDWRQPRLDAINLHHYLRPVEGEPWQDEVAALFKETRAALAAEPRKPVLMGEFGLADERWGLSPYLKQDPKLVHLHNANWAAALLGMAGTVMPWWWDELDPMNITSLFRPLADFTRQIPYTTVDLQPFAEIAPEAPVRVVGLRGEDRAYLWVASPKATWWNLGPQQATLPETRDAKVQVGPLKAGAYRLQWWDTRGQTPANPSRLDHPGGMLDLPVPPFTTDIACSLVPATAGDR